MYSRSLIKPTVTEFSSEQFLLSTIKALLNTYYLYIGLFDVTNRSCCMHSWNEWWRKKSLAPKTVVSFSLSELVGSQYIHIIAEALPVNYLFNNY